MKYTVIPVEDLMPGEPCERWGKQAAAYYCAEYNAGRMTFEPQNFSHENQERHGRVHAIVALPRPSKAPEPEQARYVVKAAIEMRHGELGVMYGSRRHDRETVQRECDAFNRSGRRIDGCVGYKPFDGYVGTGTDMAVKFAIVDTRASQPAAPVSVTPPAPPAPSKPSAERICEEYAIWQQVADRGSRNWHDGIPVDGVTVPWADVRAAWSRALAARVAASAERERLRVLVDVQHEDEV